MTLALHLRLGGSAFIQVVLSLGVCGEAVCGCVVSACMANCLRDGCGMSSLNGLPIYGLDSLFSFCWKKEVFLFSVGCWLKF